MLNTREVFMQDFMIALLDCGYADLELLERVDYDWTEIIERIKENGFDVHFNNVMRTIFDFALEDAQDMIEEIKNGLLDKLYEDEQGITPLTPSKRADIQEVVEMDLDLAMDVDCFFNYLDTHINLYDNEAIYREYFQEALDLFYQKTGHEIA